MVSTEEPLLGFALMAAGGEADGHSTPVETNHVKYSAEAHVAY